MNNLTITTKEKTMLNQEQLDQKLAESPAPRVTEEAIKSRIKGVKFLSPAETEGTLTICIIKLDNGFTTVGKSACVNPANYNKEIGEKIAYDNAFRELWQLYGFVLAEDNLRAQVPE